MSHFSDIGFNIDSEEGLNDLVQSVYKKSAPIKASNGHYSLFEDVSGAQIWMQVNKKPELIGLMPFFNGVSRRKVALHPVEDELANEMEVRFHAWSNPPSEEVMQTGDYPFLFDMPDYMSVEPLEFPRIAEIQLNAFARRIEHYESEEDYSSGQEKPQFAIESFIPSGLFVDDLSKTEAFANVGGRILSVQKKENVQSGEDFYWLVVKTLGGEIDVLADPKFFQSEPLQGHIIRGDFWLCGRFIDAKPYKKQNFIQRLLGK